MGFLRFVRAAAVCVCVGLFPALAAAQTNAVFLDSQPGDYVGDGRTLVLTTVDAVFSSLVAGTNRMTINVHGPSHDLYFDFRSSSGPLPAVGSYYSARRAPFTSFNGLAVGGDGRGCNTLTGRFQVREAVYNGTQIIRFAADFEQHCEDARPALFGVIRYNSTISSLVPFEGNYPRLQLRVEPIPTNGRVVGPGVDCGGTHVGCSVTPSAGSLSLSAVPDPGYVFAGWNQDCSGAAVTSVNVNSVKVCSATFLPLEPNAPRSMAVFFGSPGEFVSRGLDHYLSSANSTWQFEGSPAVNSLTIRYNGPVNELYWTIRFSPPGSQSFIAGQTYSTARFATTTDAGFDVYSDGRACGTPSGSLFVREWVAGPGLGSPPQRFVFDFEFDCGGSGPMTGIIQYQSTVTLPVIEFDRDSLTFGILRNGSLIAQHTPSQFVGVKQAGAGPVSWQLKSDQGWLTASPASATGAATITVKVKEDGTVPFGATATGHIKLLPRGVINVTPSITVTANLINAPSAGAPFGSIDTPLEGAAPVSGSIGVTGWALDDVALSQLRLYRSPAPGETPGQLVFIGYPVRVEGARPDVAATFAAFPLNATAGWGYMLLTNMLPNSGNGSFTLYVYADDIDGHSTLLGTRTIVASNASSTAPFGAIDTPGQGEAVSGAVNNFGWVLAPGQIRADPPAGGSVQVFIDGVPVGAPSGWTSRADLSAAFPLSQYAGTASALGVFTFDSTTLTNGTHTIAWGVTDNVGGTAGVGSRYFTVFNGSTPATSGVVSRSTTPTASVRVVMATGPIQGRLGFDTTAPYLDFSPAEDGTVVVQSRDLDRIELRLLALSGHLVTPDGAQPLPMGAAIDNDGTFTWQPGVAYLGAYQFLFDTTAGKRRVKIVLAPQR